MESLTEICEPLIIVIDDNSPILMVCKTILEMNDYQVETFEDFNLALGFYRENQKQVKAILLDMYLANTDYRITIPALLLINPKVKIICMSGSPLPGELLDQVTYKIEYFLKKPFHIVNLLEVIASSIVG
jgi:DNA-binding NtrC family response regulator